MTMNRQSAPEVARTWTYVRQSFDLAWTASGQTLDLDSCLTEVEQRLDRNHNKVASSVLNLSHLQLCFFAENFKAAF